jgi:hypothetical protein
VNIDESISNIWNLVDSEEEPTYIAPPFPPAEAFENVEFHISDKYGDAKKKHPPDCFA